MGGCPRTLTAPTKSFAIVIPAKAGIQEGIMNDRQLSKLQNWVPVPNPFKRPGVYACHRTDHIPAALSGSQAYFFLATQDVVFLPCLSDLPLPLTPSIVLRYIEPLSGTGILLARLRILIKLRLSLNAG